MEYYGFRCRFAPINWMFNVNPVVNGGSDLELGIFIFPMYIYIFIYSLFNGEPVGATYSFPTIIVS